MILQFIFAVCRRFELSCVNLPLKQNIRGDVSRDEPVR